MRKVETDKEQRFLDIADTYKEVVAKVCYLYATPDSPFDDLYQEVMINLWQGLDSFRGESKVSTWIYRMALNTCITMHRANRKHQGTVSLDDIPFEAADTSSGVRMDDYQQLKVLIDHLNPIDKAIITLWLDEKPYGEIAAIMGFSATNVGIRLHRIKEKLQKLASR